MQQPIAFNAVERLEIFSRLTPAERAELAAAFETIPLKRGDALMRQGDPADAMYVVVSGRFAVTVAGHAAPLSEIGPDQPVGEIAFLAGGTRTATVTAMRDGLVLRLDHSAFEALVARHPALWRSLTVMLARRIGATTAAHSHAAESRPRTVTIIRAGARPVPAAFLETISDVFTASARALVVRPADIGSVIPANATLDSAAATDALNALESAYDYVVYVADDTLTAWSEKALRQADLVLAAGVFESDAARNELETRAATFLPPESCRLVLLHGKRGRISGTSRWLKGRAVIMHHHAVLGDAGDAARVLRFIHGTARGLVAGGGGALCAAHVGLFKALSEAGVEFDIMGGTSGGGAMAAAFALGTDPDDIDRRVHDIFVANSALRRITWPRYSLLDHTRFDAMLDEAFGGFNIEDLRIPYFAISTDLSSFDLHRHRTGDLWTAVRASGSIPVLLPPLYTEDGHMLVDGGLLDNVPIRVMHEMKEGPNVVISFEAPDLARYEVDYRALPSRRHLLGHTFNPLTRRQLPQAPGLTTVLMRSLTANRRDFMRHIGPDDLLMMPPLPADAGLMDWHRHSELMEATHAWGKAELARLAETDHPALRRW